MCTVEVNLNGALSGLKPPVRPSPGALQPWRPPCGSDGGGFGGFGVSRTAGDWIRQGRAESN